jgi:hypothetical protein
VNFKKICEKQLFDIASCKCLAESICSCSTVMCNDARLFLEDQRPKRCKIIGLKYLQTEPKQNLDNMNLNEGASTSIQQEFHNVVINSMYSSEVDTSSEDVGQDYK